MTFATGFETFAFQTVGGGSGTTTPGRGGNASESFLYVPYHQQHRQDEQQEKIKKQKTELEKLESVLTETERKQKLAAFSSQQADKRNAARLAKLEQEYLDEISRLLVVRDGLMRRIRQSEDMLIIMIAMKRKRLRTVNWRVNNSLAKL